MQAEWRTRLEAMRACSDARKWAATQRGPAEAWRRCHRGDWLLWVAARAGVDRRIVVLAACDCARLALVHVRPGEDRPRIAIETAEAWARGEATIEQVRAARNDAACAAACAAAAYTDDAAAAAYAGDAAAAYAAAYTDAACAAAAYAAAAYTAARDIALKDMARIVRRRIAWRMVEKAAG